MNTQGRTIRRCSLLLTGLVALALFAAPRASAQEDQPEVAVMQTTATGQPSGLQLRVFFTMRNAKDHRPIPLDKIESAKLQLSDDSDPVSASLEDPSSPIKIALLLDESGSMMPYINQVRSAAKDAIDKAPDQAEFAIFRFSDVPSSGQVEPNLGFTPKSDSGTIKNFIDTQYNPQNLAPTCLYNAALQALHYITANVGKEERRAIILFTDGKDERADGQPCSDRSLDDVIREATAATAPFTPIYTVGLCTDGACGNIDSAVLTRMSEQTNALSKAGLLQNLTGLFYDVMDDLRNQKLAQVLIKPCEEKQATLLVKITDFKEPSRRVIPFSASTCYAPPATARIDVPQPNQAKNVYVFPIDIENLSPLDLQGVAVQVIDPNNTSVYTNTFSEDSYHVPAKGAKHLSLEIPAKDMIATGDYTIKIQGITQDGTAFVSKPPIKGLEPDVLGAITFKHVLSGSVQVSIVSVGKPDYQKMQLPVTFRVTNKNILSAYLSFLRYQGSIFEGTSEILPFGPTEVDLSKEGDTFSIMVPLPDKVRALTAKASYAVVLTLLAPQDPRFGTEPQRYQSERYPFDIEPPPQPSFWTTVGVVVMQPFVLIGIAVVVLVLIAAILYPRLRPRKRDIPRPFNSQTILRPAVVAPPNPAAPPAHARPPTEPAHAVPPAAPPVAPPQYNPPPAPQYTPPAAPQYTPPPVAPQYTPPPAAGPAAIPSSATVLHTSQEKGSQRVWVKIVQTINPAEQLLERKMSLPCVIGREQADLTITGDVKMSRAHAKLISENGVISLVDLNSANGTFIGDTRLEKGGSATLSGRTRVRLGPNTTIEIDPKG